MSKHYKWICDWCGEEYDITSSQLARLKSGKQKSAFCSIECKSESQKRRIVRECAYCHTPIERTEYQSNKNESVYCSKECKAKFLYETTREHRICVVCGKVYLTKKISTQRFCTPDCANEYQKTRVGRKNAKYKRVECECDYCHNPFDIRRYRLNDGGNHFCSKECSRAWYANVLSQSEEFKQGLREKMLQKLHNREYIEVDSKPQLIVDSILDNLKVDYEREYVAKYYSVDNLLIENGLMIEVQGDYFHANPLKYEDASQINETQSKRISRDKAKHTYIKNYYGVDILYLWERDIIHRPDLCRELIKAYVGEKGKMENYNSFNYSLFNGKLQLNSPIIISYQEK